MNLFDPLHISSFSFQKKVDFKNSRVPETNGNKEGDKRMPMNEKEKLPGRECCCMKPQKMVV